MHTASDGHSNIWKLAKYAKKRELGQIEPDYIGPIKRLATSSDQLRLADDQGRPDDQGPGIGQLTTSPRQLDNLATKVEEKAEIFR